MPKAGCNSHKFQGGRVQCQDCVALDAGNKDATRAAWLTGCGRDEQVAGCGPDRRTSHYPPGEWIVSGQHVPFDSIDVAAARVDGQGLHYVGFFRRRLFPARAPGRGPGS